MASNSKRAQKSRLNPQGVNFKLEGAGNSSVCKHVTNTGEIEPGGKSKTSLVFTECTNGKENVKPRAGSKRWNRHNRRKWYHRSVG